MTSKDPRQAQVALPRAFHPRPKLSSLISWSKNGFIAYASSSGSGSNNSLYLTYLENINGVTWQLAEPQVLNAKLDYQVHELALVSWSNLSTDLAVVDVYGNFFILLAGVGLLDGQSQDSADVKASNGTSNNSAKIGSTGPSSNGSAANSNGSSTNGNANGTSTNGTPKPALSNGASANGSASPSYELTSYNHMEMIYRDLIPESTNLSSETSFVAFKWLNIEKPQIINKPATLVSPENGDQKLKYTYGVGQYQPYGITHPISTKQSCVALRKNGEFVIYYQGEHKVEYHKSNLFLSEELVSFTTASIGFGNEKQIVVVAYDSLSQKIITYTVTIDWGFLIESAKRQKADPHFHTPIESQKVPKLSLQKVQKMNPLPQFGDSYVQDHETTQNSLKNEDSMDIDSHEASEITNDKFYETVLASIDVISANAEKDSKPEILISYSTSLASGEASPVSSIYRYRLTEESELISDTFTDLGLRKKSASGDQQDAVSSKVLVLQDILTRPGRIRSMISNLNEYLISIYYEDSSIDILDRTTLKVVNRRSPSEEIPSVISTIFDVGFEFPELPQESPLVCAISPNLTSLVYLPARSTTHKLALKVVEQKRFLGTAPKHLFISSVGLAFRHAYSCYTNTCSDDLIIVIQSEIARLSNQKDKDHKNQLLVQNYLETIITESHKAINFELDKFSKESVDKLLSNPPLQKLLSLQLILGEISPKNAIMSDIAWIVLNLRSASFGIMFSLSSIYRQISKKKPTEDNLHDSITRGECIMSLIGNMKWLIDLMVYLNQELLQLSNTAKAGNNGSKINIKNSSVLPIILSKVPRLFLMYALSSIGKTHEILKKLHKDLDDSNKLFTPMKESLNRCFSICNNSPLTLSLFENFLRECDNSITKELANKSQGKEKGYALNIEQKLVCQGELPDDLISIARTIIEKHNVNINRDMKVSDLYFYDVDWLNIGISKSRPANVLTAPSFIEPDNSLELQRFTPRLKFSNIECVDALRKIVINSTVANHSSEREKSKSIYSPKSTKLRKCTRCRSLSLVLDPRVFDEDTTIGLWTMVFQRTCICGNSWVNL